MVLALGPFLPEARAERARPMTACEPNISTLDFGERAKRSS
jgi:hypothetical protein